MDSVHVVGAGPAGSVAAISALRGGKKVFLSEEHPSPGTPVDCSGLISREGLGSLSDMADYKKHILNRMRGATLDFSGHKAEIDAKKPVAFVIDRASFDLSLAKKAESEGASLHTERISSSFRSDCIIGADGPNSSVASHFQFPKISRFALTARCMVRYDGEKPDFIRAYLSNSTSPGFFSWLIPHNEEYAEIGTGTILPRNPLPALRSFSRKLSIPLPNETRFALIPLSCRKKAALRKGGKTVLLAGDAAGQVKSTTGGGVYFGTSCARLAGKYPGQPETYEEEWRKLHHGDLNLHHLAHRTYGMLPDPLMNLSGRAFSFFGLNHYLSKREQMDRPTRILHPSLFTHALIHPFQKQKTL